jgi:hypothetical protein
MQLPSYKILQATGIVLMIFFLSAWVVINFTSVGTNEDIRNAFTDSYWVLPLFGGIIGVVVANQWGGIKSVIGKCMLFLSWGLIFQALGQITYALYFYLFHIEVPYPSLGDVAYLSSVILYIISAWYLARIMGVWTQMKRVPIKLSILAVPILILVISYKIFLADYDFADFEIFKGIMDFGQPLGQAIYISFALLAAIFSWKKLGGKLKGAVLFMIFGFFLQYCADFYYAYRATYGGWRPAYISDLIYIVTYFITSQALLMFAAGYHRLSKE